MSLFRNIVVLFFLFNLIIIDQAWPVQANEIGRVVILKGNVQKVRGKNSDKTKVSRGDNILVKDQLILGKASFVKILLKDDTIFQLGPNSNFKFDAFNFRSKNDRDATYQLIKGQMRGLFTQKNKKKSIIIKTPTASMGIRGTELLVDVLNRAGKVHTDIALLSGNIDISYKDVKNIQKSISLKKGNIFSTINLKKSMKSAPKIKPINKKMMRKLISPVNAGGSIFISDSKRSNLNTIKNIKKSNDQPRPMIKKNNMAPKKETRVKKINNTKKDPLIKNKRTAAPVINRKSTPAIKRIDRKQKIIQINNTKDVSDRK